MSRTTMADIAKHVGLSKATVSLVLNNAPSSVRISERSRQRIFETAARLNYRPSSLAQALAKGKTGSFGMIAGDIHSPYFAESADLALHEAERRGYHLLLSATEWEPRKEMQCLDMLMQRTDGVLMWSGALEGTPRLYRQVLDRRFPLVVYGREVPGVMSIAFDWSPGMEQALTHLVRQGHRRVGFVGQAGLEKATYHKRLAYLAACEQHGVEPMEYDCPVRLEAAKELGRTLAEAKDRPTALIVFSDYLTMGVAYGLRKKGAAIPRDIALVGVDGTTQGELFHPSLTSIAVPREAAVTRGLDLLVAMQDKPLDPQLITLSTQLIVRESA